ncbi:hypothetical protein F4779DRAFT_548432 [Xylariaceae sp. FL0662B]|nr:hypothetical protein F4779DRAFT_548432 [Xylariaceae sp. FL0662B]
MGMRVVAIEEHFHSQAFSGKVEMHFASYDLPGTKLADVGTGRIEDMDRNGITVQVVSQTVYDVTDVEKCRNTNDQLHQAVKAHPDRLAGFACLPTAHVNEAVAELKRCVGDLGFNGALINNTVNGEFLDNSKYFPLFAAAADLGVPIYIHPSYPTPALRDLLFTGDRIQPGDTFLLSTGVWGWHSEVGLTTVRLIASGLFDRLPDLQLIIGHCGEMVPFMIGRIEDFLGRWMKQAGFTRGPLECLRNNFYMTTSGMFTTAPLKLMKEIMPMDRICFSVDYPFSPNEDGRRLLDSIDFLDSDEMERFAHGNVDRLLHL